jgi:hypothetical protein
MSYGDATMSEREAITKMIAAIDQSNFRWRTIRGIAADAGVGYPQAASILAKSDKFVKARKPTKSGEALYTTTSKYKKETPLFGRIFGAAANTIFTSS